MLSRLGDMPPYLDMILKVYLASSSLPYGILVTSHRQSVLFDTNVQVPLITFPRMPRLHHKDLEYKIPLAMTYHTNSRLDPGAPV